MIRLRTNGQSHLGCHTRGFSLVAAVFILVVLAALGVFIVTIAEVQRSTSLAAALSARAYYAAASGLEWGIYQAVASSCVPTTGPFALTGSGFSDFAVTVTCENKCVPPLCREAGVDVNVYAITSTARFGVFGAPGYVARTLQVTVTNAP